MKWNRVIILSLCLCLIGYLLSVLYPLFHAAKNEGWATLVQRTTSSANSFFGGYPLC